MINSVTQRTALPSRLQDGAAAFFAERVDLLAGEADQQAVFLLMLGDIFHDVGDGLRDGHPLDCSLTSQLLGYHPKKQQKSIEINSELPV